MRAFLIYVVLGAVLAPAAARAATSSSGDVESVVVFADRAKVTRARTVTCEKGTARATFDRLRAKYERLGFVPPRATSQAA